MLSREMLCQDGSIKGTVYRSDIMGKFSASHSHITQKLNLYCLSKALNCNYLKMSLKSIFFFSCVCLQIVLFVEI